MPVHDTVERALASQFETFAVRDRIHAVPPHEVYAVTVDGRRAICKVATGPQAHLRRDAAVLRHVDRATSLPTPEVLAAGVWGYVTAWLDGVPAPGAGSLDPGWARTAGAGLATLHAETGFDRPGVPRAADGLAVDGRETTALALAEYLAALRPGVAGTGHADVLDDVVGFLEAHPGAFDGAGPPVLCHGNWLPDHVGVADGRVTGVVDFERALVAPAEHDYWRAAIPLFLAGDGGPEPARRAFRAGYESVRPLPDGVEERRPLHRLVVAASFLESLFVQDEHEPAAAQRLADVLRETVASLLSRLEDGRQGPD